MKNGIWKKLIILFLCALATLISVYFRRYYGYSLVYSHFFYVPVILSSYWFGIWGLLAGGYLSLVVLAGPFMEGKAGLPMEDVLRALILFFTSLLSAKLSDALQVQTKRLKVSEAFYKTVFENSGTAIMITDGDSRVISVNGQFERLSGLSKAQIEGKLHWQEFFLEGELPLLLGYLQRRDRGEENVPGVLETKFVTADDLIRDVILVTDVIKGTDKNVTSIQDITTLKDLRKERDTLTKRLDEALAKVLSGFIPICASCKRIKDESGQWVQVESYIKERSDADFSHGICPECREKLYGQAPK